MWRFGIAAALMILLAALVAEMLLGGRGSSEDARARIATHSGSPTNATFEPNGDTHGQLAHQPPTPETGTLAVATPGAGIPDTQLSDLPIPAIPLPAPTSPGAYGERPTGPAHSPEIDGAEARPTSAPPPPPPPSPSKADASAAPAERAAAPRRPAAPAPTRAEVLRAQRGLTALGYSTGSPDGLLGRKTREAVLKFQRDRRMTADGRIDERLLAQLDAEVRSWGRMRRQEMEALAPAAPPPAEKESRRGVFGTVLGGLQRLLGRDFDSVRRPDEIVAYCRDNAETWIYDFGREAFVYCGNIVADGLSGVTSAARLSAPASGPPETAATR